VYCLPSAHLYIDVVGVLPMSGEPGQHIDVHISMM